MAFSEPTFNESYITQALATLENTNADWRPTSRDSLPGDLESHAQSILRTKCLDECENATADFPTQVVENLLRIFDQVADSFLPGPLWQAPAPLSKGKQGSPAVQVSSIVLRSLKIVSAARLALASDAKKDQPLKVKAERLYAATVRYLDSAPHYENLEDVEALLLLAELEYGRNRNDAAKARLKSVIAALTESGKIRSTWIFSPSASLVRKRNALRTALMMLHWYFNEVPLPLQDLHVAIDVEPEISSSNMEELFVTSQLRLASLHGRLKRFLDTQPVVDDKVWQSCEKAFNLWYDELRDQSRSFDSSTEDAPVNFFVFHQQYLSTRIMLSKSHDKLYKRRSSMRAPTAQREIWTCPASAKNDAIKIASSLRNYGQRHRFREAPLSFVNHISAAADIIINATETAINEDDRNAYLHISSFFCSVLKYMAEVHIRASTLLEALQQRMNNVILNPLVRSSSTAGRWESTTSMYSTANGYDGHLWQWTRHDMTDDYAFATPRPVPERPKSVAAVLQSATEDTRPPMTRQTSTPAAVSGDIEEDESEDVQAPTPSYHSTQATAAEVGHAL